MSSAPPPAVARLTSGSTSRSSTPVRNRCTARCAARVFQTGERFYWEVWISRVNVCCSRYTLKVHKKTHEGEKCFKCDLCPYSSISQRHLESHMLIHTDQKPFQCDQCDQSFRQKQLLKRHQNLYHNPAYVPPPPKEKTHECPECSRSFRHKGNLIR